MSSRSRTTAAILIVALACIAVVALPATAVAALSQPTMTNVEQGNAWATAGWWAPGVPLTGWSSEFQWTTDPGFSTGVTTVAIAGGPFEDYGEYTLSPMTNGTTYYMRVRSLDGIGGTSAWSDAISITTYPPPPVSTWIFAGKAGTKLARTFWNASSGATHYLLQRASNSSFTSGVVTRYDGPNRSYTDTGLKSKTNYYYRVRAVDQFGHASSWSNVITIKPK